MLSFLTGKYPIFNSNDDIEALMEIASIIGRRQMEKVATLHSKSHCPSLHYYNQASHLSQIALSALMYHL